MEIEKVLAGLAIMCAGGLVCVKGYFTAAAHVIVAAELLAVTTVGVSDRFEKLPALVQMIMGLMVPGIIYLGLCLDTAQ